MCNFMDFRPLTPKHLTGSALIAAIIAGLIMWTDLRADEIFFWVFAVWIVWWDRDARISIGAALAGLVAIPILLALEARDIAVWDDGAAETVAVWVYFFLVIGVGKQIWDMRRSRSNEQQGAMNNEQ